MIDICFIENNITKYKLSPHHFQEIEKIIRNSDKFENNLIKIFTDNFFNEIHFTFKKNENVLYVNIKKVKRVEEW